MKSVLILIFISFSLTIYSQDTCTMQLGTNLSAFGPGIFKDLKLSSTQFYTRNRVKEGTSNDWDSNLIDSIDVDDAGYPLAIPFTHSSVSQEQVIAFSVGYDRNHRVGEYVLLYDGNGDFRFADWSPVSDINYTPGRITFSVDSVVSIGFNIVIDSSTLGNHIRNIRIMEKEHEQNYINDPIRPEFIEIAKDFSTIRLMNWIYANDNSVEQWADRIKPIRHTQVNYKRGIAYEYFILLANALKTDIWLNIPYRADITYVDSMASLFAQGLDEDLNIYVEYGNELWNTSFAGGQWMANNSPSGAIGRFYGTRALTVFDVWNQHFSNNGDRIKTVMSGQDYFVIDAMEEILSLRSSLDDIDLVSFPGHILLRGTDYDELEQLGSSATAEDVIRLIYESLDASTYWQSQFKDLVVKRYNKSFVMYEGSPSMVTEIPGEVRPYTQAIYDANSHPGMYPLLDSIMNFFEQELEVSLFNQYTLIDSYDNPYGAYGALDNHYITEPWPPKYQVLRDRLNRCGDFSSTTNISFGKNYLTIIPNPASEYIFLDDAISEITIISASGQVVLKEKNVSDQLAINQLSSGLYFVQVIDSKEHLLFGKLLVE